MQELFGMEPSLWSIIGTKINKLPSIYSKIKKFLNLDQGQEWSELQLQLFNPQKVYLTDLPEYLSILQINANKNNHLSCHPNCLQVHKLEWGNPADMTPLNSIDTLIGS